MGRWEDGKMRRWGDGEMGRWGSKSPLGRTCGMGILGGTGILPVSCLFPGGQDAHSTHIHSNIQQRHYPDTILETLQSCPDFLDCLM
ncbi:MAG: hypothetical protein F6K26_53030 [Moorea sp. SIO2I5]|nr:hypothetical protein [Moorena sp. SIO2I5]